VMEIQPPTTNTLEKPSLRLNGGATYFFHKGGASNSVPISTPTSRGQIRG
jgi:hypothetical protein